MNARFDRQSFLGEHSTDLFAVSKIAIVGNCGGGSHVAQQFAHVGFGAFVLIDPDRVEAVNLNRMIGSRPADADCHSWKTDVIARLIKEIQPRAEVSCYNQKWQEVAEHMRDCTAIIGCLDGFAARGELEGYCRRFLLPYVDVGMDVGRHGSQFTITGQVITSLPGGPCMRCLGFLTDAVLAREAAAYGAAGGRPQVVWPNGVLASIAVAQVVALLTPWHDEPICSYIEYDGNRQRVGASNRLAHLSSAACPHYPVESVGDPFWSSEPAHGTGLRSSPTPSS